MPKEPKDYFFLNEAQLLNNELFHRLLGLAAVDPRNPLQDYKPSKPVAARWASPIDCYLPSAKVTDFTRAEANVKGHTAKAMFEKGVNLWRSGAERRGNSIDSPVFRRVRLDNGKDTIRKLLALDSTKSKGGTPPSLDLATPTGATIDALEKSYLTNATRRNALIHAALRSFGYLEESPPIFAGPSTAYADRTIQQQALVPSLVYPAVPATRSVAHAVEYGRRNDNRVLVARPGAGGQMSTSFPGGALAYPGTSSGDLGESATMLSARVAAVPPRLSSLRAAADDTIQEEVSSNDLEAWRSYNKSKYKDEVIKLLKDQVQDKKRFTRGDTIKTPHGGVQLYIIDSIVICTDMGVNRAEESRKDSGAEVGAGTTEATKGHRNAVHMSSASQNNSSVSGVFEGDYLIACSYLSLYLVEENGNQWWDIFVSSNNKSTKAVVSNDTAWVLSSPKGEGDTGNFLGNAVLDEVGGDGQPPRDDGEEDINDDFNLLVFEEYDDLWEDEKECGSD